MNPGPGVGSPVEPDSEVGSIYPCGACSASEPKKCTLPFISVQHTLYSAFVEMLTDIVSDLSIQN